MTEGKEFCSFPNIISLPSLFFSNLTFCIGKHPKRFKALNSTLKCFKYPFTYFLLLKKLLVEVATAAI